VQHLKWTRHGRRYHHQDEGKPNTFTLTTKIGEVNVDVAGDGQTFAPYVRAGASLRHGDSECVFSAGWQEIKRLGQTLVSKSRLYVQRDIAGTFYKATATNTWTEWYSPYTYPHPLISGAASPPVGTPVLSVR
jgi:hypothetical protein